MGGCPWRKDQDGHFPAEAFRVSASTAYDMSDRVFSCHEAGSKKSATCAGFLLHGSHHNMAVRIAVMFNGIDFMTISDGGNDMHTSYRAMAEANGVDPEDPILMPCRSYNE